MAKNVSDVTEYLRDAIGNGIEEIENVKKLVATVDPTFSNVLKLNTTGILDEMLAIQGNMRGVKPNFYDVINATKEALPILKSYTEYRKMDEESLILISQYPVAVRLLRQLFAENRDVIRTIDLPFDRDTAAFFARSFAASNRSYSFDELRGESLMSTIKCINGHEQSETAALHLKCTVCGGLILYKEVCVRELPNLPKAELTFEKISLIFAGMSKPSSLPFENKDVFVCSISLGDDEIENVEEFVLRRTDASSWLDFYSKYLDKLGGWMKFVGLDKSDYRLLIVDTRKPISVLALAAIQKSWRNTIVLGIIADQTSTLIEQNTSYVAIWTALKQGLPVIAVSTSYVDELIFYTEKVWFSCSFECTDANNRSFGPCNR